MDTAFAFHTQYPNTRMFLASVPAGLLLDIPRLITAATRQAYVRDSDLLPGVRRDKFPIERRALVETSLHELGTKYAHEGVHALEKKNRTRNYSHIELTSGSVVIIPAAVEGDDCLVREAEYRNSLAECPQLAFPALGIRNPIARGNALLAAVLYGPSSLFPRSAEEARPGFVVIRFPAHDWSCYVEGRVDLLARLRESERPKDHTAKPELRPEEDVS